MSVEIIVNRTERKVEIEVNRAGIKGDTGKTAYQSYLDTTTDNPVLTEAEWSERAKGDDGDSAYQVWLDAGNTGSVQDYLDSLKGEDGVTTVVGGVPEAPSDGKTRGRKDGAWVEVTGGTGGEISNKGVFLPTDNTIPASQKSTADYINRDARDFRENIPAAGFDLDTITKDGVYPMYGSYGSTLLNAPSYFNTNKRVRGTLTFSRSAQTGQLGSSYILNLWNDQESRMRLFFGAKYGGLINWQEVDVIDIYNKISDKYGNMGVISDKLSRISDLTQGSYRIERLSDSPQEVLDENPGVMWNHVSVMETTNGKVFTLSTLNARGNPNRIWFGRMYFPDTEITWKTIETREDYYYANSGVLICGDSIAVNLDPNTLSKLTKRPVTNVSIGGSSMAERTINDITYNDKSFVARTVEGAANAFDLDGIGDLVVWYGFNDRGNSIPLGDVDSVDEQTLAGAINVGANNLLTRYPYLRLTFMTPNHNPYAETPNSLGLKLSDYSDHIRLVCERLSVKVVDIDKMSNINESNKAAILTDTIHPTVFWQEAITIKEMAKHL